MSKKILAIIIGLVAILISCGTSPTPLTPEARIIQQVFEVDKPKNELFQLAMEWMAKTFKSSKAVIEYQDKEAGMIVGKGMMMITYVWAEPTYFTLTIETKDGRARATVENAYAVITVSGSSSNVPINNEAQMSRFKPEILKLFQSLEVALKAEKAEW